MFINRTSFAWATVCAIGMSVGTFGCSSAPGTAGSGTESSSTNSVDSFTGWSDAGANPMDPHSCSCQYMPPPPNMTCTDELSARATALVADVLDGTIHVVAADTGALPPAGGDILASTLNANIPDLITAKILHSEAQGAGEADKGEVITDVVISLSKLGDVIHNLGLDNVLNNLLTTLNLGFVLQGVDAIKLPDIEIQLVTADADASCYGGIASADASSKIAALIVDGKALEVKADPNFDIPLLGLIDIKLNEQSVSSNGNKGDADVKAVHVKIDHILDVIVSEAQAGIDCTCNR